MNTELLHSGGRGGHRYTAEAFGLEADGIRERFARYTKRSGVASEEA